MSGADESNRYPNWITHDSDRHAWDSLSPEQREQHLDAVEYIREEYPEEELSVVLVGTVLTFGG